MTSSSKRFPFVQSGLLLCLFYWAYQHTLVSLFEIWRNNSDYQHGFLVIPLALAILWNRRHQMPQGFHFGIVGCLFLFVAGSLRVVSARFYLSEIDAWTIPIWIAGTIWLIGGKKLFVWAAPSLAFLWFMCPLPERAELALSLPLQQLAATGSAWLLQSFGQPAVLDNTTVLLGTETLDIARTCSGLRMLLGTFAMAFAFAILSGFSRPKTMMILVLAAPVAIGANVIRIVLTAFLYQSTADQIARRMEHDFAGLLVIVLVVAFFSWYVWISKRWSNQNKTNAMKFGRRVVVWPIVAITIVVGLAFWRSTQIREASNRLYAEAITCIAEEKHENAIRYLDLVLRLEPANGNAFDQLSRIYATRSDGAASSRLALKYAARASELVPTDLNLIRRRLELAAKLEDFPQMVQAATTALNHAEIRQSDHSVLRQTAIRHKVNGIYSQLQSAESVSRYTWPELATDLKLATQIDQNYPQHAFRLAVIQRTKIQNQPETVRGNIADTLIDEMLQANSENPEAWLIRYRYRKRFEAGTPQSEKLIDADLDRALELQKRLGKTNLHIMIAAAQRERENGNLAESAVLYEKAIEANPKDVRPYLALNEMVVKPSDPKTRDRAIAILKHGIDAIGQQELPLVFPLVEHLSLTGQEEAASEYLEIARNRISAYREPKRTAYRVQLANLESWILAHHNRFGDAAQFLAKALDQINEQQIRNAPSAVAQAWSNVGQYCRRAGDWAGAARAYQRAAALDSLWNSQLQLAMAQKNEIEGNLSDAASSYQDLAVSTEDPKEAWLEAARVALRLQLLMPTELRDWTHFRRAIESARTFSGDDNAELVRLEANQLAITDRWRQAELLLRTTLLASPESIQIRNALAKLLVKKGEIESALRLAEEIPMLPDRKGFAHAILKAEIYTSASEFELAKESIEEAYKESSNVDEKGKLAFELSRLEYHLGNWEAAKTHLKSIPIHESNILPVTELLGRLAWCQQDWEGLKQYEELLKEIEGGSGALWRTCRIRRILGQSAALGRKPQESVDEAVSLAQQLRTIHPNLQSAQISSARVASFRGMLWQAVTDYERAWNLGIPRISVAVDLVGLLNELGQTEKSQRYVDEARHYMRAADNLIDQAFVDVVHENDRDAIRFAETWAKDHQDSDSFLRLGRTYALTAIPGSETEGERLEFAKQAFEKAVELDPNNIRAWGAYFRFFAAARPDPVKAREVLESLEQNTQIRELDRIFGLAQLYESIDKMESAATHYLGAITSVEQDGDEFSRLVVNERAAHFFRNFDKDQAKRCCEKALALDKSSVGARQILIQLLLESDSSAGVEKAEQLFSEVTDSRSLTEEETRIQARILFAKAQFEDSGKASVYRQVLAMLRGLSKKTTQDSILMTRILLQNKNYTAAANQLSALAVDNEVELNAMVPFVGSIIHLADENPIFSPAVNQILSRLETIAGHEIESLRLRLKRLGLRLTEQDELSKQRMIAIEEFTQRCLLSLNSEALQNRLMRDVFEFLIRENDIRNAIQLAKLAPPPGTQRKWGAVFANALTICTQETLKPFRSEIDELLSRLLNVYPDDAELCFAIANYRFMQGQLDEAIRLHKIVLTKFPDHSKTLNNMALALLKANAADAQPKTLIAKALEIDGRQPELLDTLAIVQLNAGEPQKAIETLQEALPVGSAAPTMRLHLAHAHLMLGDVEAAKMIFFDLTELASTALTPIDAEIYATLTQSL